MIDRKHPMATPQLSAAELAEIERKYDPETAFRATGPLLALVVTAALVAMSVYHFYAGGFALIPELMHRAIHISFVLALVFVLFGWRKAPTTEVAPAVWWRVQGVPYLDLLWAVLAVAAAMYLPLLPAETV